MSDWADKLAKELEHVTYIEGGERVLDQEDAAELIREQCISLEWVRARLETGDHQTGCVYLKGAESCDCIWSDVYRIGGGR